jgi:hypothetical protein
MLAAELVAVPAVELVAVALAAGPFVLPQPVQLPERVPGGLGWRVLEPVPQSSLVRLVRS